MANHSDLRPMRVVFFGMTGRFSLLPLAALLGAGVDVCAVIVPADQGPPVALLRPPPPAPIPLRVSEHGHTIIGLAWERGIPAFAVQRMRSPEARTLLTELQPDVACVACFSKRISPTLLRLPRHGFLNIHPSLLPAYRGPSPLFWVLRDDRQHAGVTIHLMDAGLDSGPIVAQQPIHLPVGICGPDADQLCAQLGGQLLVAVLDDLQRGALRTRPQPLDWSYAPTPAPADFRLDPRWSAERVFTFMRGTAEWDRPYPITFGDTTLWLTHVLRYDPTADLHAPFRQEADAVAIQFAPGIVWARARTRHHPL